MNSTARAIGYARISTAGQEEGTSLAVQRERLTAYAAEQGWDLLEIVAEQASGGVTNGEELSWEHRERLLDLMERAAAGDFEILLVAKLDRLSRDYPTLVVLERRLQRHGVEVVSCAEKNGDGPLAEYVRAQLALAAQLERALIRDRLTSGKAARRKEGRFAGGRPPFGYVTAGRGVLEPNPETAPVVDRIFRDAAEGRSPARIAQDLNRAGIAGPTGRDWTRQALTGLIRNVLYAGEHAGVRSAQPALVSRRRWGAAQRALDGRRRAR